MLEARYWARQWAEKNRNAEMRRWRGGVMPRPVLTFAPNAPTVIALAFAQGLPTKSNFGPDQVMYTLQEPPDHVTFLDADVAQKIRQLDPAVGERFAICKRKGKERNSAVRWDVWLSPESEKARAARESGVGLTQKCATPNCPHPGTTPANGGALWFCANHGRALALDAVPVTIADPSDLERQLEASLADVRRKKAEAAEAAKRVAVAVVTEPEPMHWTALLLDHTNALSDVYREACEHANAVRGGEVEPEDVRHLLITAFINLSGKKGRN